MKINILFLLVIFSNLYAPEKKNLKVPNAFFQLEFSKASVGFCAGAAAGSGAVLALKLAINPSQFDVFDGINHLLVIGGALKSAGSCRQGSLDLDEADQLNVIANTSKLSDEEFTKFKKNRNQSLGEGQMNPLAAFFAGVSAGASSACINRVSEEDILISSAVSFTSLFGVLILGCGDLWLIKREKNTVSPV